MPQTPPEILEHITRARRQLRLRWFVRSGLWAVAALSLIAALVLALHKQGWFEARLRDQLLIAGCLLAGLATALYTSRRVATERLVLALDQKAKLKEKLLTWWELDTPDTRAGKGGHLELLREALEREPALQGKIRVFSVRFSPLASVALLVSLVALGTAQLWDGPQMRRAPWQPPPVERPTAQPSAETLFERDRLEDLREDIEASESDELAALYRQLHEALDALELGASPAEIRAGLAALEEQLRELSAASERDEVIAALERNASSLSDALTPLQQAIEDQNWQHAQRALNDARDRIAASPEEHQREARELRELADAIDPRDENTQRELSELEAALDAQQRSDAGGQDEQQEGTAAQDGPTDSENGTESSAAQEASASEGQQDELERRLEELRREANDELSPEEQAQAELADELRDAAAGRQRSEESAGSGDQEARAQTGAGSSGAGDERSESGTAESGNAESGGAFSELERAARQESAAESLRERAQSIDRSAQRSGRGGNSDARSEAMDDFLRRARGESGASSSASGRSGSQAAGRSGPRGSQQAQGASGGGGPDTISREGGQGQQQGSGGQSSASAGAGRAGDEPGGSGAGVGSGGDWRGATGSSSDALARALEQEAIDSGEGLTRAETVEGAGEGGFARSEYREVFVEYGEVADEVIDREEIPSGYRYYVERYFELITPRSER